MRCNAPDCGREIAKGERHITLTAGIDWGANDLRKPWQGDYVFCSFGCLSDWASARAADHDGHVLKEGQG